MTSDWSSQVDWFFIWLSVLFTSSMILLYVFWGFSYTFKEFISCSSKSIQNQRKIILKTWNFMKKMTLSWNLLELVCKF